MEYLSKYFIFQALVKQLHQFGDSIAGISKQNEEKFVNKAFQQKFGKLSVHFLPSSHLSAFTLSDTRLQNHRWYDDTLAKLRRFQIQHRSVGYHTVLSELRSQSTHDRTRTMDL